MAIKTGRTQIHFLSNVVFAVASLASQQALAARSRVLARLVSLAQTGELPPFGPHFGRKVRSGPYPGSGTIYH